MTDVALMIGQVEVPVALDHEYRMHSRGTRTNGKSSLVMLDWHLCSDRCAFVLDAPRVNVGCRLIARRRTKINHFWG